MPAPGRYLGTRPVGVLTKSSTGTPSMAVTFHVESVKTADGTYQGMPTAYERTVYLYLSPAAAEHSYKKLDRLGFNGDFDAPQFSTESIELECKIENYNGKDREKWEIAGSGGGEYTIPKADDETIKAVAREWRARVIPF